MPNNEEEGKLHPTKAGTTAVAIDRPAGGSTEKEQVRIARISLYISIAALVISILLPLITLATIDIPRTRHEQVLDLLEDLDRRISVAADSIQIGGSAGENVTAEYDELRKAQDLRELAGAAWRSHQWDEAEMLILQEHEHLGRVPIRFAGPPFLWGLIPLVLIVALLIALLFRRRTHGYRGRE